MPSRPDARAAGTAWKPRGTRKPDAATSREPLLAAKNWSAPHRVSVRCNANVRGAACEESLLQSEIVALSCIHEEDEESPSPGLAPTRVAGSKLSSLSLKPEVGESVVDFVEPLDENLNRLQRKVASMLEMQRRSSPQEDKSQSWRQEAESQRERRGQGEPSHEARAFSELQHAQASLTEPRESRPPRKTPKESCPHLQSQGCQGNRYAPANSVQYREVLAEHYKQQLQMLDEEEAELQHQMRLRQQLRLELHEEQERRKEAARKAEVVEPRTDAQFVEEKQLELLRSLEEQLRISEERRLELERENRVLQSRIHKTQAAHIPAARSPEDAASRCIERDRERPASRSPRPREVSPEAHDQAAFCARTTSPPRVQKATRHAKTCSPPPPSPATDCRDFGKRVTPARGVVKFQHPRPARVVLPVRRLSPPRSQTEKPPGRNHGVPAVKVLTRVEPQDRSAAALSSRARLPSPTAKTPEMALTSDSLLQGWSSEHGQLLCADGLHSVLRTDAAAEHASPPHTPQKGAPAQWSNGAAPDMPTWAMPQATTSSTERRAHAVNPGTSGLEPCMEPLNGREASSPSKPRLCSGKGLVWPSLDLSWGEGPQSAEGRLAQPSADVGWSTVVNLVSSAAHERSAWAQDRGLLRSSSMACTGASTGSPQKSAQWSSDVVTEPLAISPFGNARISSLVRSSSTPLVGQSRFSTKTSHPGFCPKPE